MHSEVRFCNEIRRLIKMMRNQACSVQNKQVETVRSSGLKWVTSSLDPVTRMLVDSGHRQLHQRPAAAVRRMQRKERLPVTSRTGFSLPRAAYKRPADRSLHSFGLLRFTKKHWKKQNGSLFLPQLFTVGHVLGSLLRTNGESKIYI